MKTVAVVLSGCGVSDGSEIHESVITLLALNQAGIAYQCLAPNIMQKRVFNHFTNQVTDEQRNVLHEAARIARGNIKSVADVNPTEFAAAVYPGGYGAALNLSDFAERGPDCSVEPSVLKFAQTLAQARKPQGFICIAPALIAKIYGPGVQMTIGTDTATMQTMAAMGSKPIATSVREIIYDESHAVISTPAYMLGQSIVEVAEGINKLINQLAKII